MLEQVPDSRLGLLAQVCLQVFFCPFNISLLKRKQIFGQKYYLKLKKSLVEFLFNMPFCLFKTTRKRYFFKILQHNTAQFCALIFFWFQQTLCSGKFDAFCPKPQEGRNHIPQGPCDVYFLSKTNSQLSRIKWSEQSFEKNMQRLSEVFSVF